MRKTTLLIATTTAACWALPAGCGKPFNEQINLVGAAPLPALSVKDDSPRLSGTPSLTGLDRRAWPVVTVRVPGRQVGHYPTYVANLRLQDDAGGPWDERYPTALTALDHPTNAGADTVDALVSPAWAAGLLLWAPIDMAVLFNWPWNERRSPAERYARAPAIDTAVIWRWIDTAPARIEWTDEAADAPEPR
jgi:hypothetical protein